MDPISFMTANFVARQLDYHMTKGWMEGDAATSSFFRPIESFPERFDAMLAEIVPLGFKAIDLWMAHLSPSWATNEHIAEAARLIASRGLTVASLAYHVPDNLAVVDRIGAIGKGLGARLIGGSCGPTVLGENRAAFVEALEKNDLIFAYENHPEKNPSEVLSKIGDSEGGRIGVAVDTGWFGSQKFSAAEAIRQISTRVLHVHMKDILEPHVSSGHKDIRFAALGRNPTLKEMGHETCTLGDGVVGIEECVEALEEIGYTGGMSVEHEPEDRNPLSEVRVGFERLQSWMGARA